MWKKNICKTQIEVSGVLDQLLHCTYLLPKDSIKESLATKQGMWTELMDEMASEPETLVEISDTLDLFTLIRSERGTFNSYILEPGLNLPMELDTGLSIHNFSLDGDKKFIKPKLKLVA